MSEREAKHQCFIMTVGVQDTSAAFISALVDFMLQHNEAYQSLQAEIAPHPGKPSTPTVSYDETAEMKYSMACVYETLRLNPCVHESVVVCSPREYHSRRNVHSR